MALSDLKDRIKDIPISGIINNYIPVHKKGSQQLALCPFHNDSKPSLNVNDKKGMFMCFSCNTGGDAITFVQKYKNLDFVEAVKDIAEILGINVNDYLESKEIDPEIAMARKILSKTIQIYRKVAEQKNPKEFQNFIKNRKLNNETLSIFGIGYAPGNNAISEYLSSIKSKKDKELVIKIALKIHLIRANENSYYDVFRDRIMFPVWDSLGHPVGFGGRAVLKHQKAKYYNSQESFHFNKKNLLYGLNITKKAIRQANSVILVEGYMDLIALYQAGFENVVAVMGVAMSDNALNSLKNLTSNIYMALDSDDAGAKAMTRINKLCMEHGLLASQIDLAPHKDPDEFLIAEGRLALAKRIETAKSFVDIELDQLIPGTLPELFDKKISILDQACQILSPLGNNLTATERIITFAKKLQLQSDSTQILERYKSIASKKEKPAPIAAPKMKIVIQKRHKGSLTKSERAFIHELVQHPECLSHRNFAEILDFVNTSEVQGFVKKLRKLYFEIDESEYPAFVMNLLESEQFSVGLKEVAGASVYKFQTSELNGKIVSRLVFDMKKKLQEDQLIQKKQALKKQQSECQTQEMLESLMAEILKVEKNLNNLKKAKPKS